jgi:hypothetical protein
VPTPVVAVLVACPDDCYRGRHVPGTASEMLEFTMPQTDVFAIDQSPFNMFLFSEVGTESNGAHLTILSLLARQGLDPWDEAARWAARSRTTNIDRLAQMLEQMPLPTEALLDARVTATRLVLLLPPGCAPTTRAIARPAARQWLMVAAFCAVLGVSLLVNSFATPDLLGGPAIAAPTVQAAAAGEPH